MDSRLGPLFKRQLGALLLAASASFFPPVATAASLKSAWARTEEIILPQYLKAVLEEHSPIVDMMPSGERGLWLMTRGSIWLWRVEAKGLTHINLDQGDGSSGPLESLGTDGISLFAASAKSLFQVTWPDRRVFRYALPKGGREATLGFAGSGDDFRIIHTRGILSFDRYGKNVKLDHPFKSLPATDPIKLQPTTGTLWRIKGKVLEQADLSSPEPQFKMLLKTHNPLMNLALDGAGMVVHTPYAVLRISPQGKLLKSIPVEGRRKLLSMDISPDVHAYLFSDHLLEIYRPAERSSVRVKINLPAQTRIKKISVENDLIGILTENGAHVFKVLPE